MATFDVLVRRLTRVEAHPNADRLDVAVLDGFRSVVAKGTLQSGQMVAYIPEAAVLPDALIADLDLTGKLAGPEANRVKAVKLRGVLSQGICMAAEEGWEEGESVMERLGITKYEPTIPEELLGSVYALDEHERLAFDIENIKAFPTIFTEGEPVVFTEKIHGLFMAVGAVPMDLARPEHLNSRTFVSSKGLLASRMAFDIAQADERQPYVTAARNHGLHAVAQTLADRFHCTVWILGEVFGQGLQDLGYASTSSTPGFRAFSVVRRRAQEGLVWMNDDELSATLEEFHLLRAPVLYRGPFSQDVLETYTNGKESVSGHALHLREGVVVTPVIERECGELGRVALKSVSEAYLLRKGGTEYS